MRGSYQMTLGVSRFVSEASISLHPVATLIVRSKVAIRIRLFWSNLALENHHMLYTTYHSDDNEASRLGLGYFLLKCRRSVGSQQPILISFFRRRRTLQDYNYLGAGGRLPFCHHSSRQQPVATLSGLI